ncbi:MAG: hypothetical protein M1839_004734 [Geoglossum umbratile]|nr:MAG: hypothetical protein M1839_004734 [Geoglossum umbratile]
MFTPLQTGLGALLLHQATSILLFHNGKVLGASSILAQSLSGSGEDGWALAGMGAGAMLVRAVLPKLVPLYGGGGQWWRVWATAAMVGWGTKNAMGCTSGHMLCGLSRLSARSTIATAIFFTAAAITANLFPQPGVTKCLEGPCYALSLPPITDALSLIGITAGMFYASAHILDILPAKANPRAIVAFLAGLEFALGLIVSGMADPVKVLRFFSVRNLQDFDPSLALVLLFGVVPNVMAIMRRGLVQPPTFAEKFDLPTAKVADIDGRFVIGAAVFGISWGLTGACPGPAILRSMFQPRWGLSWVPGFVLGYLLLP